MKKIWKLINENKILSTVIGGLIVTLILRIIDSLYSLKIFSTIIGIFTKEYIVYLWGLILIALAPIGTIILFVYLWSKFSTNENIEPKFRSYVLDNIFSILWNWKYIGNKLDKDSLMPLCPKCKRQLEEKRDYTGYPLERFYMECPNCHFKTDWFQGDYFDLSQKVFNEILGRIRNNEYLEVLKKKF